MDKQIGQFFIFGFEGTTVPKFIRTAIENCALAGVILFKRNIDSKEQLQALIQELKGIKPQSPLFISVDHEGGRVFRLPPPFTPIPTGREIGLRFGALSAQNPGENIAYQTGQLMGKELREVGFNLNFAPVLDVDTHPQNPIIGDRAYSSNPLTVAQVAKEIIGGLRSQGIIPCGKHFPGHGDTSLDSHLDLPIVDHPRARLDAIELVPFRAAIQDQIEMLMTAHILYPQLDREFPATLSRKILTDLLRNELGYQGVVISDDLWMKAIADRYGLEEATLLFFKAGGDLALICKDEQIQQRVLERTAQALEDGELSPKAMRSSQNRILQLRAGLAQPSGL